MNQIKFLIQVCKGLIRHHRARRTLMFYSVLFSIVLVFAGVTLLWNLLRHHPFLFLGYWAGCAWMTLLSVLLALYDLAKVRQEARREKQRLYEEYLRTHEITPPKPENRE